jgi:hypothetical protein
MPIADVISRRTLAGRPVTLPGGGRERDGFEEYSEFLICIWVDLARDLIVAILGGIATYLYVA